jgi:hypothetical protein
MFWSGKESGVAKPWRHQLAEDSDNLKVYWIPYPIPAMRSGDVVSFDLVITQTKQIYTSVRCTGHTGVWRTGLPVAVQVMLDRVEELNCDWGWEDLSNTKWYRGWVRYGQPYTGTTRHIRQPLFTVTIPKGEKQ